MDSYKQLTSEHQWSPEQISLRLREGGILDISHERIYQHIILDQKTGGHLYTHLRQRKKRRKRYGGDKERRGQIPNQVSIDERPAAVEARDQPGTDWEDGLIIGSKHRQAIVTLVDRCTRYTFLAKVPFKTAQAVQEAICKCLSSVRDVQDKINNRPRKVLGMRTPNELLFGIKPVALGY